MSKIDEIQTRLMHATHQRPFDDSTRHLLAELYNHSMLKDEPTIAWSDEVVLPILAIAIRAIDRLNSKERHHVG